MSNNQTIIIGIAGASASGKSLLSNTIVQELGNDQVVVLSEDEYCKDQTHLPAEERAKVNYDHPDAYDHELLMQHLIELKKGNSIEVPQYNFKEHAREKTTTHVEKHRITVLEGILLFVDPKLRDLLDIKIYMETPLDICLIRRLKRDMLERGRTAESVLEQYQNTVRPMFLQFIEPSKRYADVIIPRGGENRIAINMLKAKITHLLND
jgi:uridine kinase